MLEHLQRLASVDDDVAGVVVVDVPSLERSIGGTTSYVVDRILEACQRGGRTTFFFFTPASRQQATGLIRIATRGLFAHVRALGPPVICARDTVASILYDEGSVGAPVTLVTADFDQPWVLATRGSKHGDLRPVVSALDVKTGKLWLPHHVPGAPEVISRAEAILRMATRKTQEAYRDQLANQLAAGIRILAPSRDYHSDLLERRGPSVGPALPEWFRRPWEVKSSKLSEGAYLEKVDREELRLLGWSWRSPISRAKYHTLLQASYEGDSNTGYVCAAVRRGVEGWKLTHLVCRTSQGWEEASAEKAAALLLRFSGEFRARWFGPHIIDVLAWAKEHGVAGPNAAGDPAWSCFILDPEQESDLGVWSARVLALTPVERAWLGDVDRSRDAPRLLRDVAHSLPSVDRELSRAAVEAGVSRLLHDDIERTLPALAVIERRGVALRTPDSGSWHAFDLALTHALTSLVQETRGTLGTNIDIFRDTKLVVRAIERSYGKLVEAEQGMRMTDLLRRYITIFGIASIERARTLGAFNRERPLHEAVSAGAAEVHPVTIPQKNGRLGQAKPRLQSLGKKAPEAIVLRSALRARQHHVLLASDYNAFEARLAAELSSDSVLLAASKSKDLFDALARQLFNATAPSSDERLRAKLGFYAILYGQTEDQFWKKQHALPPNEARRLYQLMSTLLGGLLQYRDTIHEYIDRHRLVTTRGGWTRRLHAPTKNERRRDGFSALVQGFAADIFRRVIRDLTIELRPFDAAIVHHVHDELVLEAPRTHQAAVSTLLEKVMTGGGSGSPLIHNVKLIVKSVRHGETWADLL